MSIVNRCVTKLCSVIPRCAAVSRIHFTSGAGRRTPMSTRGLFTAVGIVVTAVSILHQSKTVDAVETVRVAMRDFTDKELDAYLATGDPLDKAGAYAIQGAGRDLVASLDGDYLAVVGLPLRAVAEGLAKLGCTVTVDVDRLYRERAVFNWRTFEAT